MRHSMTSCAIDGVVSGPKAAEPATNPKIDLRFKNVFFILYAPKIMKVMDRTRALADVKFIRCHDRMG